MSTSYYFPTLLTNPVYPLEESMKDGALRSNPENGIVLARDRFNRNSRREWKVKYEYITTYEKQLIDTFVQTVRGGARSFYWANPATSSELITNGGFGSTTLWTGTNCTLASVSGGIVGNCLQITRTSGTSQSAVINASYQIGSKYIITGYVKNGSVSGITFTITVDSYYDYISSTSTANWTKHDFLYDCAASTTSLYLIPELSSGTILFDEISMLKVTNEVRFSELPKYSYIINDYWNCDFAIREI